MTKVSTRTEVDLEGPSRLPVVFSEWKEDSRLSAASIYRWKVGINYRVCLVGFLGMLALWCIPDWYFWLFWLGIVSLASISRRFDGTRINHLFDLPSTTRQIPVRIKVAYLNEFVGEDVGVLSINGNLLHFDGAQTCFGLESSWCAPQSRKLTYLSPFTYLEPYTELSWTYGDDAGLLRFYALPTPTLQQGNPRVELNYALQKWFEEKGPECLYLNLPPRHTLSKVRVKKQRMRLLVRMSLAMGIGLLLLMAISVIWHA